jgi:hypothetical protein
VAISADTLVSLSDFKVYAGITTAADDVILQQTIDRASIAAQTYCGRKFVQQDYIEIRDTTGQARLALRQSPVSVVRFVGVGWDSVLSINSTVASDAFVSVAMNGQHLHLYRIASNGGATQTTISLANNDVTTELAAAINSHTGFLAATLLNVPTEYIRKLVGRDLKNSTAYLEAPTDSFTDYIADLDAGIIHGRGLDLPRSMLIDYTAGYEEVPLDVQQAVMMIAQRIYHGRKRDFGVQSESLGGYSYSLRAAAEIDGEARALLDGYRRLR